MFMKESVEYCWLFLRGPYAVDSFDLRWLHKILSLLCNDPMKVTSEVEEKDKAKDDF